MIRISGVVRESIVDGPGLRFVLFTQGCPHKCPSCHNPSTHDFSGGYEIEWEKVFEEFSKNPLLKGITLSGGEPFVQSAALIPLAKAVKDTGKDIVIYSGYTYEQLLTMAEENTDIKDLMSLCDILIDGPFILEKRDLTLLFRGSSNQRIIDLKKSDFSPCPFELSL